MFDEEPDDDPHGRCRHEIRTLEAEVTRLRAEVERLEEEAMMADPHFSAYVAQEDETDGE